MEALSVFPFLSLTLIFKQKCINLQKKLLKILMLVLETQIDLISVRTDTFLGYKRI